ncbi:antibiotic biosynthesis monooxygenase family protein [Streptomyces sp. NPDC001663]|uniref:antibiotic biosynthesis monooxygenase family protein n=1 Tax=Streptomyces sp. NPDC001663 TaxID=3364597 RepID=UPI0036CBB701
MIYEHARLTIDPADAGKFEEAVPAGREALLGAPGCREVSFRRSVDQPGVYLLEVGWDDIADHLEVFPTTPQAARLADAIASFWTKEPEVIHFDGEEL